MSWLGQTLLIPARAGSGSGSGVSNIPTNNYVGMIGASSVAAGGNLTGLANLVSGTNVAGVQFWATMLSDGGLCWGGASATGGFTVQEVYDTHWPIMRDLTPKRGFVGFYAGTNDSDAFGAGGVAQPAAVALRKEIVRDFIQEARANGQVPFVVAPQPNESSAEGLVGIPAWRLGLIDLCAEEDAIFVDVFNALGNPATGTWDSATYTETGVNTGLHIGPLGGPLAAQAIVDALMPYRNPNHNPHLVSVGDETTNWGWQGGRFALDSNVNNRPDGGGTGLATDVWGAPSNTSAFSLEAGTGDVSGNWLVLTKTGTAGSSSTSLTSTSAPGKLVLVDNEVWEVAYHMRDNTNSDLAGFGLKLHEVASGSTYLFYHRAIAAQAVISDKIIWALHESPSSADYRINYSLEVGGAGDTGDCAIAMLSLRLVEGSMAGSGTAAWYGLALDAMRKGNLELDAGTFKIALASSSYTPNVDTDQYRSALGTEVTGTNWSTGGVATTVTLDHDTANNRLRVFCTDISVATVTLTDAKHAVLYKSLGGAASADPLIGYVTFDVALAPTAGTLAIDMDGTNGFLREAY